MTDDSFRFQVLWRDGERVFCRGRRLDAGGHWNAVLAVLPAAEHPTRSSLDRLHQCVVSSTEFNLLALVSRSPSGG